MYIYLFKYFSISLLYVLGYNIEHSKKGLYSSGLYFLTISSPPPQALLRYN